MLLVAVAEGAEEVGKVDVEGADAEEVKEKAGAVAEADPKREEEPKLNPVDDEDDDEPKPPPAPPKEKPDDMANDRRRCE